MFVNTYDLTMQDANGNDVNVSLRLGIGSQIKLKKKYKESTTQTLFGSADDIEKFVDIMNEALNWQGNENPIKSGEELLDLMAGNDMLGMAKKQHVITSLGTASGIFSDDEKAKIDERADHMFDNLFKNGDADDEENTGKNK